MKAGNVLRLLSLFLPWPLRRRLLQRAFGYELHPTSRIGFSWVFPGRTLVMGEHAIIGHLTVCHHLDDLRIGSYGAIGPMNWITGYPTRGRRPMFAGNPDRRPELLLGEHAAITTRHYIDCTDSVRIGRFTTFAGCRSVVMSHSVDVGRNRQRCAPVTIGEYCFVGTNCVVLGGSALPDRSVLGAMSLLNRELSTSYRLYGGSPAREIGELDEDALYFHRSQGCVD